MNGLSITSKKSFSLKLKRRQPESNSVTITRISNIAQKSDVPNLGDSVTITPNTDLTVSPSSGPCGPVTPKKQAQITSYLSPPKNIGKVSSPARVQQGTPKKSVRLEFDDPTKREVFSPKIKNRPSKYFSKDEMPVSLAKVSPSPKKRTPKRKASLDPEGTPSPKQRTLDLFLTSKSPQVKKSLDFRSAPQNEKALEVIAIDSDGECTQSEADFLSSCGNEWENSFSLEQQKTTNKSPNSSGVVKTTVDENSGAINKMNCLTNEHIPKKKTPLKNQPTQIHEFESFIYYLIRNPMSELAIDNSVLPLDLCAEFFTEFQGLDSGGQHLYARMYARKRIWYRLTDLNEKYRNKCEDIKGLVQVLVCKGFVSTDCKTEDLDTLLNLLQVPELKTLCKIFNQKDNGKRELMIERLTKCAKNQKSLFKKDNTDNMKDRLVTILGDCVRLCEKPKEFFNFLLILATYPYYTGKESERLNDLINQLNMLKFRKIIYPNYEFKPSPVFKSFKALKEYLTALKLADEMFTAVENKNWPLASEKVLLVKQNLLKYLKDKENIALLETTKSYLLKFTAGQQYCYCLSTGVTVLKKDNATLDSAVECLELLLEQKYYLLGKRGSWYEELALIYQSHIKDLPKACSIVIEGLTDETINPIYKMTLSQRGETLLRRKKSDISDEQKLDLRRVIDNTNCGKYIPNSETIVAIAMPGVIGRKQVFKIESQDESFYSSVEEVVIHHYKNDALPPYKEGIHDEGRVLMNLILAAFYDIIYCQPLEDESFFHCQMQIKPLDWGSKLFYVHREKLIQNQLNKLRSRGIHGLLEDINKLIGMGITCLIDWNRLENVKTVKDILLCLGMEVFLNIAEHVIKDYKSYHSGFPDLMLWDPPSGRCLFVEVKGPYDQLSYSQSVWLKNLNHFGADAIVAHVETPGTTLRRKK